MAFETYKLRGSFSEFYGILLPFVLTRGRVMRISMSIFYIIEVATTEQVDICLVEWKMHILCSLKGPLHPIF